MSFKNRAFLILGIILLFLVGVRMALPPIGKHLVNKTLSTKLDSYTGAIEDFDLRLITGTYFLQGLYLNKKQSNNEVPFLTNEELTVHLNWSALFKGKIAIKLEVNDTVVKFIDATSDGSTQLGMDEKLENWQATLDSIVPFTISQIDIKNLEITFSNDDIEGANEQKLLISSLSVSDFISAKNNRSDVAARATLNDHSEIDFGGIIGLNTVPATFDLSLKVSKFDLTSTNKILRHYIPIDFTEGDLTIYSGFKGDTSNGEGYARVFFEKLQVYHFNQSILSPKHALFEFLGAFSNWIIDVVSSNTLAAEIPITWTDPKGIEVKSGKAFWSAIENTYDSLERNFKDL